MVAAFHPLSFHDDAVRFFALHQVKIWEEALKRRWKSEVVLFGRDRLPLSRPCYSLLRSRFPTPRSSCHHASETRPLSNRGGLCARHRYEVSSVVGVVGLQFVLVWILLDCA